MKKSLLNKHRLIYTPWFTSVLNENALIVLDIGARGALDDPWKGLSPKILKIIGFEPDKDECDNLNRTASSNRLYFPNAVWNTSKKITLYLAQIAYCSSIYPPNFDLIKSYRKKHWETRITAKQIQLDAVPLDQVMLDQKIKADFIKIDTQGSEFEIIQGAEKSLGSVFGVLLETWTTEVHLGQTLMGDIFNFMKKNGFDLFDTNVAAAWKRKTADAYRLYGKQKLVGLDLLFLKDIESIDFSVVADVDILKWAAIAECFGFPDYAIELIEAGSQFKESKNLQDAKKMILEFSGIKSKIIYKLKKVFYSFFGLKYLEYPSLHY